MVKEANPEDGADFTFSSDIPGGSNFSLDDEPIQTDTSSQSITFGDLISNTYTITEILPSGWQLDSAACAGGSDNGRLNGEALSVALGAGEAVVCTFSNTLTAGNVDYNMIYMPIILKGFTPPASGPDLVVDDLVAGSGGVTVTIRNAGTEAVEDSFWVDVYFNPTQTPGLNQPWQTIAPAGAVWGVTADIPAGDTLILSSGGAYYFGPPDSSAGFPVGAQVYAYVDSVNYNTNYGNVQEGNEGNNLFGPTVSTAGNGAAVVSPAESISRAGLPQR